MGVVLAGSEMCSQPKRSEPSTQRGWRDAEINRFLCQVKRTVLLDPAICYSSAWTSLLQCPLENVCVCHLIKTRTKFLLTVVKFFSSLHTSVKGMHMTTQFSVRPLRTWGVKIPTSVECLQYRYRLASMGVGAQSLRHWSSTAAPLNSSSPSEISVRLT
jgi:hypothetical protein